MRGPRQPSPGRSPDGKALFYVAGPSEVGSVTISTQPAVNFGMPVRVAAGFFTDVPAEPRTYDMLPDGQHFIGLVPAMEAQEGAGRGQQIRVVLNWFEDVKRRVAGE